MGSGSQYVSVIIPAYNAQKTIDQCLQALMHQTIPLSEYEVIVVDDGSTDQTRKRVEAYKKVLLISQAHAGPAAARNLGVEHAKGEILLFTDADCIPKEDWIELMVAPFFREDIVGVKGTYLSNQSSVVARFVQLEYEDKYDRMGQQEYIDFIDTYSAGFRRDVFIACGGFDRHFPTSSVEDQELSFRLDRQGLKMVFQQEAKVYHVGHASTLRSYFSKKYWIGYWKIRVIKRHPGKMVYDTHTPQVLKFQILMVALGILFLLLSFIVPLFIYFAVSIWLVFFLTTLNFIVKAWHKDRSVALISPWLLLLRAIALGFGLFAGILNYGLSRS